VNYPFNNTIKHLLQTKNSQQSLSQYKMSHTVSVYFFWRHFFFLYFIWIISGVFCHLWSDV